MDLFHFCIVLSFSYIIISFERWNHIEYLDLRSSRDVDDRESTGHKVQTMSKKKAKGNVKVPI